MSYGEVIEISEKRLRDVSERGGIIVGYLYPHTPIELFLAHGITPSLIHVNPSVPSGFEDSLQTYSCAFTRNIFSQRSSGDLATLSGFLFPGNTCDALQNVGDVWRKRFPDDKIFRLTYPVSGYSEHSVAFLTEELKILSDSLHKVFRCPFSENEYTSAIALVNDFRQEAQFLYSARAVDPRIIPYTELTGLIRAFLIAPESQVVEEITACAFDIRQEIEERKLSEIINSVNTGLLHGNLFPIDIPVPAENPRILVLGGMVDPQAIASIVNGLENISDAIITMDMLSFGFKVVFTPKIPDNKNPFKSTANTILQAPLEPTQEGLPSRVESLKQILSGLKIDGIVVSEQSFCDPDEFEAPSLEKAAKDIGIPSLRFPIDPELSDRSRLEVRLETFLETLSEVD
ncbi:MAG: 2-hydroxyacyl-CoA dehydratase subunit D [Candidatus Thorarchaeota archaeon]